LPIFAIRLFAGGSSRFSIPKGTRLRSASHATGVGARECPSGESRSHRKKVAGTYLLAGAEFHNHYAHLFCDVLPRWKLFEDAGLANQFPALLPPPGPTFAEAAWHTLGTDRGGIEALG